MFGKRERINVHVTEARAGVCNLAVVMRKKVKIVTGVQGRWVLLLIQWPTGKV